MGNEETAKTLTKLHKIQYNMSYDVFVNLFGQTADHLWKRFSKEYHYNLLDFYNYLDGTNKRLLSTFINQVP